MTYPQLKWMIMKVNSFPVPEYAYPDRMQDVILENELSCSKIIELQ